MKSTIGKYNQIYHYLHIYFQAYSDPVNIFFIVI